MHVEFTDCFDNLFYDKSPKRLKACLVAKLTAMQDCAKQVAKRREMHEKDQNHKMLKLDEQRDDRSKSDEKWKSESSVQKTFSMKLEQDEYKIKVLTLEDLDE